MKKMKKIKRIGAILLIFLLNINSLATSIDNNGGSAFITKAEFDALKSSFQTQIDTYNQSIDSKIDNAIASYLAGVALEPTCDNYWERIDNSAGHKFWFLNHVDANYKAIATNYPTNYKPAYNFVVTRELYYRYWSNPAYCSTNVSQWNSGSNNFHSWSMGILTNEIQKATVPVSTLGNGTPTPAIMACKVAFMQVDYDSGYLLYDYPEDWNESDRLTGTDVLATNTYDNETYTNVAKIITDGNGAAYIYTKYANGQKFLRQVAKNFNLGVNVNIIGHTYKDWGEGVATDASTIRNCYSATNTRDDITGLAINFSSIPANINDIITVGTKQRSDYEGEFRYGELNLNVQNVVTDEDLTYCQMGTGLEDIVSIERNFPLKSTYTTYTLTADKTESKRRIDYYTASGLKEGEAVLSGVSCSIRVPELNYEKVPMNTFSQETASNAYGEDVRYGNGIPIIGKSTGKKAKIKYKLKSRDGAATQAYVGFSNKPFNNGSYASGAQNYGGYTLVSIGVEKEISIDIDNNDVIWVNMYANNTSGTAAAKADAVTFDVCDIKISND